MNRKFLTIVLSIMAIVMIGCNLNRIYESRVSLESEKMVWDVNNKLNFEVDIEDTAQSYDILVQLRILDYYTTSNMWLFINTEAPTGATSIDTLECKLRDEKGFSNSTGMNIGEFEDYEIPFKQNIKFAAPGHYKFVLQHGMRIEKLPFVNEVGIILEKSEQSK